jgi:hypothetical protein
VQLQAALDLRGRELEERDRDVRALQAAVATAADSQRSGGGGGSGSGDDVARLQQSALALSDEVRALLRWRGQAETTYPPHLDQLPRSPFPHVAK